MPGNAREICARNTNRGQISGSTFANRILGFINAPAVWQWVMAEVADLEIDPLPYQEKRDVLWEGLTRMGYEVTKPQGTFYMFPKAPIADDLAFVRSLMDEGILAVPGQGLGGPDTSVCRSRFLAKQSNARCPDSSAPCIAYSSGWWRSCCARPVTKSKIRVSFRRSKWIEE